MRAIFHVTEDDLTNALFYSTRLASVGTGTMAEARQQARAMLAVLDPLRCVGCDAPIPAGDPYCQHCAAQLA